MDSSLGEAHGGGPDPGASMVTSMGPPSLERSVDDAALTDGSALEEVRAAIREFQPKVELSGVERAYEVARKAHEGQRRKSGEAYMVHPLRVAHGIAKLGLDTASITASLLHDVVEDTSLSVYDVTEQFGREVATIVDGVTKLGKVPYLSRQEQQAESFRKMLLAMSQDIRVLIVKLIDRLDNMRTLQHVPREKQERIARETMQIYAPLASRLGIEGVRRELQDLSFRYLEPVTYQSMERDVHSMLDQHPGAIERNLAMLEGAFTADARPRAAAHPLTGEDEGVHWAPELGEVSVRATRRSIFRVHRRLEAAGRGVDQLSDVVTYQVVVRDRVACYAALGVLHGHLQPTPGRFRDYIAMPRPNHYRALHTSLIGRDGMRVDVQIRSARMDDEAERGVVASWRGGSPPGSSAGTRLTWLQQLMDWQEDVSDPGEFLEAVKADLFADEVYVFTPEGDVHTFQKGATPIDFAFAIHSDLGLRCSGARVNGQVVPLRYRLRQGDTVEIITNPNHGPREEWLKMCVSSRARAKIKQHLRAQRRDSMRVLGRSLLEQALSSRKLAPADALPVSVIEGQAERLGLARDQRTVDGVFEAVGEGQLSAEEVAAAVAEAMGKRGGAGTPNEADNLLTRMLRRVSRRGGPAKAGEAGELGASAATPIVVTRERIVEAERSSPPTAKAMIQLAGCCNPVVGDPLVGFFEAGRGITAHVAGCPQAADVGASRRVHLTWASDLEIEQHVTLEVRTGNAVGLLAEMSRVFSERGADIKQANCRTSSDGSKATNTFHATVRTREQLDRVIAQLKTIEGVLGVDRVYAPGSGVYPRLG